MTVFERDYREAEKTIVSIDVALRDHLLGHRSAQETVKRIMVLVGRWTDPKEEVA